MVDNRSVTVTLKLDENKDNLDVKNQTGTITGSSGGTQQAKDKAIKAAYTALVVKASATVVNEVTAWADYAWNRQLTLNDDYVGQREKSIAIQQINTAVSALSNTISGAAIGSVAGPIGAMVGAMVGLVSSIAGIARSNIQGRDQQDIMIRQMTNQLEYTRSRIGWSTHAASIGEDL